MLQKVIAETIIPKLDQMDIFDRLAGLVQYVSLEKQHTMPNGDQHIMKMRVPMAIESTVLGDDCTQSGEWSYMLPDSKMKAIGYFEQTSEYAQTAIRNRYSTTVRFLAWFNYNALGISTEGQKATLHRRIKERIAPEFGGTVGFQMYFEDMKTSGDHEAFAFFGPEYEKLFLPPYGYMVANFTIFQSMPCVDFEPSAPIIC